MPAAASNIATTPTSGPTRDSQQIRRPARVRQGAAQAPPHASTSDLNQRKLSRETVLAAVVRLLDTEYLRVGNEEYAKDEQELRRDHAAQPPRPRRPGSKLKMRFAGKHGIVHEVTITDRSLQRVVRRCQELPGQPLFQYVNGDGEPQPITSADVNDYIREATGGDFTAKHFRTWGASVIAFEQLLEGRRAQRSASRP